MPAHQIGTKVHRYLPGASGPEHYSSPEVTVGIYSEDYSYLVPSQQTRVRYLCRNVGTVPHEWLGHNVTGPFLRQGNARFEERGAASVPGFVGGACRLIPGTTSVEGGVLVDFEHGEGSPRAGCLFSALENSPNAHTETHGVLMLPKGSVVVQESVEWRHMGTSPAWNNKPVGDTQNHCSRGPRQVIADPDNRFDFHQIRFSNASQKRLDVRFLLTFRTNPSTMV